MMKFGCCKIAVSSVMIVVLCPLSVLSMTIQLGADQSEFVPENASWAFFRGREAPSDPLDAWRETDFNDLAWEQGTSGFGYGDGDDDTSLNDMRGNYVSVYIRKVFAVPSLVPDQVLELEIDYDDGFIAYINGQEVARRNMPEGPATHLATASSSHEAGSPERIVLGPAQALLVEGENILAVEGHNTSRTSSDFSLAPALRSAMTGVRHADIWFVETDTVSIHGHTNVAGVASVTLGGQTVTYEASAQTWTGDISLLPGLNTFTAQALDADAQILDANSINIMYIPMENHIAGELTEHTTWSGAVIVEDSVMVPTDVNLTIDPGTFVLMQADASLLVQGQLAADGNAMSPIYFTRYENNSTWKQIVFADANDSYLNHCIIEYADSEGAHQDYYEPGPRDYHEAVMVIASQVDFNDCTFQHLPNDGRGAEGDAIAVISDDPDLPGPASAHITGCQFLSIGQGVHTRYAYVLVEDCFFTGKRGDNDDVDLYGESTPAPLIKNNVFLDPEHDDMINPTKCSAVIIGNIIAGSDDHGVVLRDRCFPVMMNNLIYDCSSAGIAIENSCEALLVNNTIVDCGRGVRLLDLGRWGPPYRLQPGGGIATLINCLIWDCPRPITLAHSANTAIDDRGSHITIEYCDIQGGENGVSKSGAVSTVTWGQGNINADPLFVDPANQDFQVRAGSPVIDAGIRHEDLGIDINGYLRPCGDGIDMGAYEFGQCEPDPNDAAPQS